MQDVAELQKDVTALTTGWRQSALEVDASCMMEVRNALQRQVLCSSQLHDPAAVTAAFACRPLRALAQLRLRIHPAAELSGLGALKAEGGKLYHALSTAANQIAELRAEHRYVHSPLKRNVKELSLLVKSQDILLRALTRKHSPRRASTLQSVAEEDERSQRSSHSSNSNTPPQPRPNPHPAAEPKGPQPVEEPKTPVAEPEAQAPAQSSSEPFPLHVVHARSMSTVSDASLGALSAPQSATGSTPRPTILGRESRTRSHDANEVADQLATLLLGDEKPAFCAHVGWNLFRAVLSRQPHDADMAKVAPGSGANETAHTPIGVTSNDYKLWVHSSLHAHGPAPQRLALPGCAGLQTQIWASMGFRVQLLVEEGSRVNCTVPFWGLHGNWSWATEFHKSHGSSNYLGWVV
ncbi:Ido1 [Symbiodinium natans]|uniref:Ido1 protein n=1 Tax=Symbiodinium natans TaxID=878477 RepID=A0A812NC08_9DINO|nr:Ido1 [Symbiodinium natans]